MSFHYPAKYQIQKGIDGGTFKLPQGLFVIASNGGGWEHVSVSKKQYPPTWDQMCMVKDLFWDKEDWVVQYHPAESEHINHCSNCLHLWRPIGQEFPKPPRIWVCGGLFFVGLKGVEM